MKKFCLVLFFCFGCASQPFIVKEADSPRIIVKDMRTGQEEAVAGVEEEFYESVYPDPTRGYIENKAWPYAPKVWLIKDSQKTILVGPEEGIPQFWNGEIREFSFPPGNYTLYIERWRRLPEVYGGWQKIPKTEIIKLAVAQFESQFANDYYGWRIIIYPTNATVH